MVNSWLPEPTIGHGSDFVNFAANEPDNEEQENIIENNIDNFIAENGYRLLSDTDNQDGNIIDETDEEDEEDDNTDRENNEVVPNLSNNINTNSESNHEFTSEYSDLTQTTSRDITVDNDQIRAIMTRVTLPASATPSWAALVPDSEWCSFLQDRIRVLQSQDETKDL